jgi:hypothetical protein
MLGWKRPEHAAPAVRRSERGKLPQSVAPLPTKRNSSQQKKRGRKRSLMSMYHEVMEALTPLVEAFEQLGITYYIGGSVSSSLHGMARRTKDVDVIVDIMPGQVRSLARPSRMTTMSTSRPGKTRFDVAFPTMCSTWAPCSRRT